MGVVFDALGSPRVPVIASVLAVATNVVVILLLHPRLGFTAVALGTAIGSLVNVALLAGVFEGRVGGLRGRGLGGAVGKMVLAALTMLLVRADSSVRILLPLVRRITLLQVRSPGLHWGFAHGNLTPMVWPCIMAASVYPRST